MSEEILKRGQNEPEMKTLEKPGKIVCLQIYLRCAGI